MQTLTLVKYALALAGVAVVIFANNTGRPQLGYAGLVLIAIAFFLRFVRRDKGPADAG